MKFGLDTLSVVVGPEGLGLALRDIWKKELT